MIKFSLNRMMIIWAFAIILSLSAFLTPGTAFSQYCTPKYNYAGIYMGITYVGMGSVAKSSDYSSSSGYNDYTSNVVEMKPGDNVSFTVKFGNSYPMELSIFVDWNADGKFDPKTELVWGSEGAFSSSGYDGSFTVPQTASFGSTRIRVMTEYSYMYYWHPEDPCGTNYYYGETEDYGANILPNAPDASISAQTSPVVPFRVGNHPINVTLKSNNKAPMKSVFIDWWLNNTFQGTVKWTGTLNEGQTANISLGTVNLDYPDGSNYGPFQFKFQTRNPNDFEFDANPDNDLLTTNLSPILNDAGVLGFFGPPEGFGPGVTQVRARVRNYAPKPLTSVTINWKIDNVAQTPVTITGINIPRDQTQDLVLGTYNFYAKTPLGPFTVECISSNPNGVTDQDQSNDKYNGGIGPSLAAGTYTIGGSNAHFASPSEAASYINSSGVFGEGKVTFMVNPGTYTGQIVLNSPLPRKNPIEFIGNAQFISDVIIAASPSAQNNFVILLDGMNEIAFTNLTLRNNNNNSSNAGNIVTARNTIGLKLNKINLLGVASSPRYNTNYALVNLLNSSNVVVSENTFNNGSVSFYTLVNSLNMPYIHVHHNDFYNFSWMGIYNQVLDNLTIGGIEFNDNRFISNSGLAPVGGISSMNSTSIQRNEFTGVVGTGNVNEAVIYVKHTTQNPSERALIISNMINNAVNLNGILVDGAETFVNKNYVNTTQTANYSLASFRSINAIGTVGNNQFIGKNMMGVSITSSPKIELYYNSIVNESNSMATVFLNGVGKLWRNIVLNNGTAPAYQVTGTVQSNQNVFFSKGNVLISDNGVNHANLSAWQTKGNDTQSATAEIEFESLNDLKIKYYNSALLQNTPLFNDPNSFAGMVEASDYYGTTRASYFVGANELNLTIRIERQTNGFSDCVGSTTNILTVSSAIDYNAPMNYQWELDNRPIPGATEPILYFKNLSHNQSGIYRCKVGGPGATQSIYSRPVSVYVTRPTDITREPESQKVALGELAVLSFDAHVNGLNIEDAIANDEVKVRWYKYVDEANDLALVDNKWISGSRSNYLTIHFRPADQGEYYAIIEGLCGTVKTVRVSVMESINDITIIQHPSTLNACSGTDLMLNVDATTQSAKSLKYQWYKNGTKIIDQMPKIEGSTSKYLVIYGVDKSDAGDYYAIVSLEGTSIEAQSTTAKVTVTDAPVIKVQPQDATVQQGKQLLLDVIAEGDDLNYSWYKDNELIITSENAAYVVDPTTADDDGVYFVEVYNDCGKVKSDNVRVTITTGTTNVFEVSKNGFSLTTASPNPVSSIAAISFSVPTVSMVKITLTDATGVSNVVLAEGQFQTGSHTINLDAKQLNLVSGTYFYFLESNGVRLSQKLVVVR